MYNRYILQPDGTYRKNRVPDAVPREPEPVLPPPVQGSEPPEEKEEEKQAFAPQKPKPQQSQSQKQDSAGSFLRNLLPRNLDTGDLMIIILLLLMSADCPAENNTALLTLALYLFL